MPKKNVITKSALAPTTLIAGGAGFIGSYLAENLLQNGSRVIVVDNFNTGKQVLIDPLLQNEKFAFYNANINEGIPPEIESVDYIFHLAGLEEYLYSKEYIDLDSLLTNALGTKNLLDFAQRSSAKFLLASTIDVYQGMMSQLELNTYFGHTPIEEHKYTVTEAKRYAEALVWEYFKKYQTDVRIARLPEIYGPKMNLEASGSLGKFIKDLVEGHNLTIVGEGTSKEYYVYITDAVSALSKALFNQQTAGNIYSIISSDSISELETAFLLKSLANTPLDVEFKPAPDSSGLRMSVPDTFTLRNLNWQPKVSFKEGVTKTLESLDYYTNTHPFKPAKLIEEKKQEKKQEVAPESVLTLSDVKPQVQNLTSAKPTILDQLNSWASSSITKSYNIKKSFSLPKISVKLPKLVSQPVPSSKNMFSKIAQMVLAVIISAAIIFLGVPLVSTYVNAKSGESYLMASKSYALSLNSKKAIESAKKSNASFIRARGSLSKLYFVFKYTKKLDLYSTYYRLFSSLAYVSKSVEGLSYAIEPYNKLWQAVNPASNIVLESSDFDSSKVQLTSAQSYVQLSLAEFKYINKDLLPKNVRQQADTLEKELNAFSSKYEMVSIFTNGFPDLVGSISPKRYMILFQNSNEIRPTGGFIGSYGIVEFTKGKISNIKIDDVYNPDGQIDLRGIKVAPPKPISDFLAEDTLHIRNANWSPDFPESARTILDLYYRVTGEKVDGVICLDLYFVKDLLDVTGPVFLASYNEDISSQNIYERTQYYSEYNFEPGSTQKKNFLTILGSKIMERFFSLSNSEVSNLFKQIYASFDQKHLAVYLSNNSISAVLQENKWDGSLAQTNKDYLFIVNSNLGGTKANYYVKNSYDYQIMSKTRDGVLRAELNLTYDHTGKDDSWPGGPYTNYVRILTQSGAKLTGAKILYKNVNKEEDIFSLVKTDNVLDYNSFETSFILQPNSSLVLTLNYDLPETLNLTQNSKEYSLYWQKQAGTQEDRYNFVFNPPFGVVTDSPTTHSGTLDVDKEIYLKMR